MTVIKISEKLVQKAICDYLTCHRIFHWRQNSGVMIPEADTRDNLQQKKLPQRAWVKKKKERRYIRFLFWLYPKDNLVFLDIGGILPLSGRYFTCECKATGKKPTKEQYKTMEFINKFTGASAIWADSLDMFIQKFDECLAMD